MGGEGLGDCNLCRGGMAEDGRSGAVESNKIFERIKKLQNSPWECLIVLLHFLPVRFLPQGGAAWGMGFVIHGGLGARQVTIK